MRGRLDVSNRGEAYRSLEDRRLTPVNVRSSDEQEASAARSKGRVTRCAWGDRSSSSFTEELADLLDAGVQLQQALGIMTERQQHPGGEEGQYAPRCGRTLRDGATFAAALRDASPTFDELYCNLVAAGEASGSLTKILKRLASSLTILHELQMRVVQAMIYPGLSHHGMHRLDHRLHDGAHAPVDESAVESTNQQLPAATQALVDVSQGFATHWWRILARFGGAFSSCGWGSSACPAGRLWWDYVPR